MFPRTRQDKPIGSLLSSAVGIIAGSFENKTDRIILSRLRNYCFEVSRILRMRIKSTQLGTTRFKVDDIIKKHHCNSFEPWISVMFIISISSISPPALFRFPIAVYHCRQDPRRGPREGSDLESGEIVEEEVARAVPPVRRRMTRLRGKDPGESQSGKARALPPGASI